VHTPSIISVRGKLTAGELSNLRPCWIITGHQRLTPGRTTVARSNARHPLLWLIRVERSEGHCKSTNVPQRQYSCSVEAKGPLYTHIEFGHGVSSRTRGRSWLCPRVPVTRLCLQYDVPSVSSGALARSQRCSPASPEGLLS
jgi:hypothetical protein